MQWFANLTPTQQFTLFSIVKIVCVIGVMLPTFAYSVMAERRIAAFIQDRVGPNRVGPFGILQPMADGIKAMLKEDFTPDHVRKVYFWLAPAITVIPSLLVVAVIPFGSTLSNGANPMVIADLNVGILYTFGIVSLGVYGIVLAGYAANSKYSFLGGIRSSAQMVSYEIAMGMSVVPIFMLVGNLNLSAVVDYQAGRMLDFQTGQLVQQSSGLLSWLVFKQPLAFIIFLVAAFAETNRLPFDLPESEQELVGGYNTEYSSMKFAMFFMGEYFNLIAAAAMMVTLFFGGWTLPFFGLDRPATSLGMGLLHVGVFFGKVVAIIVFFIWVRWMLPRFRYDQLMDLGWRRFIPLALANILITAVVLWMNA